MPESTDLSVAPYFDDFAPNSHYYKVLFQPGVSVQVRELNFLQSMLQNQVEQFGDNILTQGTIVSGCVFQFHPTYPYVKLKDNDLFGVPVVTGNLVGFFAQSSGSGLSAYITNFADGFESQTPDLKTMFVTYLNGGNDGNTHVFTPGETIFITDANVAIWTVNVVSAGIQFSNSDFPVFTPALIVNVTSGSFLTGDYVTQPSTGANLQVANVDTSTLALEGQTVLYLTPRQVDLANSLVNSSAWAVANNDSIRNAANTAVGTVLSVQGNRAAGSVLTDGSGRILQVPLATGGAGYNYLPIVSIRSIGNPTGLASVSLFAQNFLTKVVVANTADAVGNGYAFGTSAGVIYQKGYFLRVEPQTIVIDKYDVTPNAISAGYHSVESIISPQQDPSLFDNALGTQNFQAPGANRLQIVPTLLTTDTATISPDFLSLVVWSEGNPFLQRQDTSYGVLERHLAQRERETAGNFAVDQFRITTRSPSNNSFEGNVFSVAVDPGIAYVDGYRVETQANFIISDKKGYDTNTAANVSISLNYDDYILVNNTGGVFLFTTGDTVNLYDTAKGYASNAALVASDDLTPAGNTIGTARIRSMFRDAGTSGPPSSGRDTYRMYLFNVKMANGQSFSSVRSLHYNNQTSGGANGVADVLLANSPGNLSQVCRFANTTYDTLIFSLGVPSLQDITNVTYTYRTIDQTLSFANTGILTKTLAGSDVYQWANGTSLTSDQLLSLYVVPTGNDMQASVNVAGTGTVNTTVNTVTGSSTTFTSDFAAGDFINVASNSTVHEVHRIVSVTNSTAMQLDSNSSFSQSGCAVYRYFPKYLPIPFGFRTGLVGNVDGTGQVLTLNLGTALDGSASINAAVGVDVVRSNVGYGTKTAARHQKAIVKVSNNSGGNTGPWCLGISDTMRLRSVTRITGTAPPYANDAQVTSLGHDVTRHFYIDQRQNPDYLDLSNLCVKPDANLGLSGSDYLVVDFDAFNVSSNGFFVTPSYVGSSSNTARLHDGLGLANLGSFISSWEIPTVSNGPDYYDLIGYIDFRPIAANTASSTSDVSVATVNPAINLSFGNTASSSSDRKFPTPDSILKANLTFYTGRFDRVNLGPDAQVVISQGQPGMPGPNHQSNVMSLGTITIPPYPCLPQHLSNTMGEVITLRTLNEKKRLRTRTIMTPPAANTVFPDQPRGYDMSAIQGLEDRIRSLEYYQSLSAMQTDMVNRVIPSGMDPTVDRFKYGLFVDSFSTRVSQDYDDPTYMATIQTGELTPEIVSWYVRHGAELMASPYLDYPIVSQTTATGNATAILNAAAQGWLLRIDAENIIGQLSSNIPTTQHLLTATINNPQAAHIQNPTGQQFSRNKMFTGATSLVDLKTVQFASNSSAATLYFFVPKTVASITSINQVVGFLPDPDKFIIFQNNTVIKSTILGDAHALTNADVTFLQSNAVPAAWFTGTALAANDLTTANGFVVGSGKISWTHNPAAGNQYTIQSTRQTGQDHWRWALSYPAPAPTIPAPVVLANGTQSFIGTMYPDPDTFVMMLIPLGGKASIVSHPLSRFSRTVTDYGWTPVGGGIAAQGTVIGAISSEATGFAGNLSHPIQVVSANTAFGTMNTTLVPQYFNIIAVGLKASTQHTFKVNGQDQSAYCRPFGGSLGDPIKTDASGQVSFDFFYPGNSDQALTSTLLSNTAPITTTYFEWLAGNSEQPLGDGVITMELTAPNSISVYQMALGASPEVPLNLLKNIPQ